MNSHSKGLAAITGASAGIGAVYANRLARRAIQPFEVKNFLSGLDDRVNIG